MEVGVIRQTLRVIVVLEISDHRINYIAAWVEGLCIDNKRCVSGSGRISRVSFPSPSDPCQPWLCWWVTPLFLTHNSCLASDVNRCF